jgi:hypothetical protein
MNLNLTIHKLSNSVFVLIFIGAKILLSWCLSLIGRTLDIHNIHKENPISEEGPVMQLLVLTIIGPIMETALLQALPIKLTVWALKEYKHKEIVAIILAAIIFSAVHPYSFFYMVIAFVSGVVYALAYILSIKKHLNAFLVVFIIHASYNLFAYIINEVL